MNCAVLALYNGKIAVYNFPPLAMILGGTHGIGGCQQHQNDDCHRAMTAHPF